MRIERAERGSGRAAGRARRPGGQATRGRVGALALAVAVLAPLGPGALAGATSAVSDPGPDATGALPPGSWSDVAAAAAPAVERRAADLSPAFAGVSVDTAADGSRLTVRFAEADPGRYLLALRAAAGAAGPRVAVEAVPRGLGELRELHERVVRVLADAERSAGVASEGSALDVRSNAVVVWVPGDGERVREILDRAVGSDGVRVVEHAAAADEGVAKHERLAYLLVVGGQRLDMPAGDCPALSSLVGGGCRRTGYCTSGFPVRHPHYGDFVLTAGHCVSVGDRVRQGGTDVGPVAVRHVGGRFDAGLVSNRFRTQVGRVHVDVHRWFEPVHWSVDRDGDPVGATVCHAGVATNGLDGRRDPARRCGVIVSREYAPPSRLCPDERCRPVFRLATYGHRAGDSGAPVYWETWFGRGAVGIHKGSGPEGHGVYSHLPYVLRAWGLRLTPWR